MATSVDICNLALGMLVDSARVTSISPADGSPNAAHCARWYPIALRKILEEHDWSFAIRRARGSSIDGLDASLYERKYAYLLPADCVRLLRVSDAGRISYPCEYDVELYKTNSDSRAVFTDAENAVLTYVSYCDAPSVFPSSFTQALVILLAAYLVGPVKRMDSASDAAVRLFQQYESALSKAKTQDAKTAIHHRTPERLADCIRARMI